MTKLTEKEIVGFSNLKMTKLTEKEIEEIRTSDKLLFLTTFLKKMPENLIREFSDRINWVVISWKQDLSESFIRDFKDKVDWACISQHQVLSENFIREFSDKVYWYNIVVYQKLSQEFIYEFYDKIDWKLMYQKEKLDDSKKCGKMPEFKNMPDPVKLHILLNYREISHHLIPQKDSWEENIR